jgi:hypothetical protein
VAEAGARHGLAHGAPGRDVPPGKAPLELPREHGFWVMLGAVVLSAFLRSGATLLLAAAALTVTVVAILGAVRMDRLVRRDGAAQVLSAGALGALSFPLDVVAGRTLTAAAATGLAWVAIFAASALVVRSLFARAGRRASRSAPWLAAVSVLAPGAAALGFALAGSRAESAASLLTAAGLGVLVLLRPTVKQLKPVGIGLAVLHAASAVVLAGA